jgi:hypothetical protein
MARTAQILDSMTSIYRNPDGNLVETDLGLKPKEHKDQNGTGNEAESGKDKKESKL